jgi:hypothetical protein
MSKRLWWPLAVLLSMNIGVVSQHKGFCPPVNFKPAILEFTSLWNAEQLYFRQESGVPAGARR